VLLLLYPRAGEEYVVFMRRPETMEHHKGQISLPGGAQDSADRDLVYTALREAHEELGIDPNDVEVIGTLPEVYARVSGFLITPVLGRLKMGAAHTGIVFKPNTHEVAEVIEVPLSALNSASHRTERRTHEGKTYNVHFYTYGPYEIWGATGRIIHQFLSRGQVSGVGGQGSEGSKQ
jgi:8-oxo-dGTP pyrophosphatase MutT (NUDIX family)